MATQAPAGENIDIGRVIGRGFGAIGRHGAVFLALALLLVGLPQFIMQYLLIGRIAAGDLSIVLSPIYWVGMLVAMITAALLQAALVRASIQDLQGKPVLIGPNLAVALSLLLPMIGLTILTSIVVAIGFLLVIVPGIIFYLMLSVAVPVLVEERRGVIGSMRRSMELTKGSRWRIFLLMVVLVIGYFIIAAILGLLTLVAPGMILMAAIQGLTGAAAGLFFAAMVASLYVELRTVKEGAAVETLGAIFS